jgi:nicotinamide-nucleotide amidase
MFPDDLVRDAEVLVHRLIQRRLTIAAAESCTGGLIAGLLTEIPGASAAVERGFVTYSNAAKTELLGVPAATLDEHGAVSRETALAMAAGALLRAPVDIAVAVTGVAGPGGGTAMKPVGLVHLAVARKGQPVLHQECRFGDIGRTPIRIATVREALALIRAALDAQAPP